MKTVCKKLLCLMLVAMMLVSAVPFAFAAEGEYTFWYELWVDGVRVDNKDKTVTVAPNTAFTETEIKAQAKEFWPDYFDGTYEFDKITESTIADADNKGVRVWLKTPEKCQHEDTVTGTVAATCEEAGSRIVRCTNSDCRAIVSQEAIPALGHNYENGVCTRCSKADPNYNTTPTETTAPTTPNYGTLRVTVYTYNANYEAKETGTVKLTGKSSYTLGKALAEEVMEEVGIVNYEEYQWQGASGKLDMTDGQSYNVNLVVDPVRTPGNRKIVTLKIMDNDGTSNSQTVETLAGTKILDVLAYAEEHDYFDEPTRKGYRLAGYSFDMNCSNDINRDDVINADMTIYCEWERTNVANKYDVSLRVYTNGDTQYVDKVLDLEDYAGDGKITRTEVENLLDKKYSAKSGYSLAYYGLFTTETWDDGDYDLDDAVSSVKVDDYGKTVIYVMVKNVKKAVADDSNPKTGDNIMIAATTLALSAAALVSIVELKKRKMI